jgi:hypothetical protein
LAQSMPENDMGNERIVRAELEYEPGEIVPLP